MFGYSPKCGEANDPHARPVIIAAVIIVLLAAASAASAQDVPLVGKLVSGTPYKPGYSVILVTDNDTIQLILNPQQQTDIALGIGLKASVWGGFLPKENTYLPQFKVTKWEVIKEKHVHVPNPKYEDCEAENGWVYRYQDGWWVPIRRWRVQQPQWTEVNYQAPFGGGGGFGSRRSC